MNANIYAVLARGFGGAQDRCVIDATDGARYSFAELERYSARVASLLASLGVGRGQRVLAQVEKSPQALFVYLGCVRAGCIYVPLNTAYRREELALFMADARPAVVICGMGNLDLVGSLAAEQGIASVFTLEADGSGTLREALRGQPDAFRTSPCRGDEVAAILYTSGTTGRSKGAMITHRNLACNALTLHRLWGFREGDVLLHALPIFHVHGLFVACHCALLNASTMLWLPAFNAARVASLLPRASVYMGVPTHYSRLLAEPGFDRASCRNMRLFVCGSAPLAKRTFEQFLVRTGFAILERYGMTETGMTTSNPLDGERLAGTVGCPLPGVEVRVVDEALHEVPPGTVGQLLVRGENVFCGYWGMPEKTAVDLTEEGWFKTGDLALVDARGYVSIVGRNKDLIISGGLNVYPREVEGAIETMEAVREAAVIGLSHPDLGEAVVAIIVRNPSGSAISAARVIEALRGRIASFKLPKRVFFVDELPRNAMGKVQKAALREHFRSRIQW